MPAPRVRRILRVDPASATTRYVDLPCQREPSPRPKQCLSALASRRIIAPAIACYPGKIADAELPT
jgi:hypothetical protein